MLTRKEMVEYIEEEAGFSAAEIETMYPTRALLERAVKELKQDVESYRNGTGTYSEEAKSQAKSARYKELDNLLSEFQEKANIFYTAIAKTGVVSSVQREELIQAKVDILKFFELS